MKATAEMLLAAVKEAVRLKIFPKFTDQETYLKNWENMEKILNAALSKE